MNRADDCYPTGLSMAWKCIERRQCSKATYNLIVISLGWPWSSCAVKWKIKIVEGFLFVGSTSPHPFCFCFPIAQDRAVERYHSQLFN